MSQSVLHEFESEYDVHIAVWIDYEHNLTFRAQFTDGTPEVWLILPPQSAERWIRACVNNNVDGESSNAEDTVMATICVELNTYADFIALFEDAYRGDMSTWSCEW